jgi:Na+/H+-dicarboxylate symporter
MCVQHDLNKKKSYTTPILYLVAILLGVFSGLANIPLLENIGLLVSDVFVKIFKCISLPIIALSLIVTLSSYVSNGGMHKLWQRTICYTLATTIIAAGVTCGLYLLIQPENVSALTESAPVLQATSGSYLTHLTNMLPSNIFSPFLEHQVMGVLLIGIVVGIAIRYIKDDEPRKSVLTFFKGAHGIFFVITAWVVKIIPLGLYGFITATVIQLKGGSELKGIGKYLLIVIAANLIQGFVVLPLWLKLNKIKPFTAMRGMLPALSIAFFSKSSTGALPVTIKSAEQNLNINPKVSRFVLPLCTTINMNGCAAFIFATVIYLMQNHGIAITPGTMFIWIFIATIAAVGNAGVPMGCFFLSASLLSGMDIPITLLGVILPFYSLIDMVETALNVWSDSCVTKVVDKKAAEYLENPVVDSPSPILN